MILVGPLSAWQEIAKERECIATPLLFNMSSKLDEIGIKLDILPDIDDSRRVSINDLEFDQILADYVINNDKPFCNLMGIISMLDDGFDVYIAIGIGDIYETLAESFTKLIQVRYGYNSQFIHTIDDIDWFDESEFSAEAINSILSQDIARFKRLTRDVRF